MIIFFYLFLFIVVTPKNAKTIDDFAFTIAMMLFCILVEICRVRYAAEGKNA